jgi:ABC-2 type transport system permease protein
MKTILHIVKKEFLQFKRDRKMLAMSFIAPVFQLVILGYAANLDVRDMPTVVFDPDNSTQSRELVSDFVNSGYFDVVAHVNRHDEIDGYIDNGSANLAVVFPPDFGENVLAGRTAQLQAIADGADANTATIGLNYVTMAVQRYSQAIQIKRITRSGNPGLGPAAVDPEVRVWYNPELKSRNFMVPGVLALLLMVITMILTSLAIVKEREIGTMEQLIVTPIRPYQLIIGKLAPFTIIGLIDIMLVLVVAGFWFKVPIRGNIPLLYGLCGVFLLTTLGLGLLVSTISRNQQQAMMTAIFFVMMPMMFLSGFVFPIENMPRIIQFFTYFLPLRYFFVIVRGLFLKGVGLAHLWDESLALLAFGVIIMGLSIGRFRKSLE